MKSKKYLNYIPRFLWPKDIKRCGNCRLNTDRCFLKEIENPCIFWKPYQRKAKKAKLIKI